MQACRAGAQEETAGCQSRDGTLTRAEGWEGDVDCRGLLLVTGSWSGTRNCLHGGRLVPGTVLSTFLCEVIQSAQNRALGARSGPSVSQRKAWGTWERDVPGSQSGGAPHSVCPRVPCLLCSSAVQGYCEV